MFNFIRCCQASSHQSLERSAAEAVAFKSGRGTEGGRWGPFRVCFERGSTSFEALAGKLQLLALRGGPVNSAAGRRQGRRQRRRRGFGSNFGSKVMSKTRAKIRSKKEVLQRVFGLLFGTQIHEKIDSKRHSKSRCCFIAFGIPFGVHPNLKS